MRKISCVLFTFSISLLAYAGGNPDYVVFPEGYKTEFTKYDTRNRVNGKQVAVLYANKAAVESANGGPLANGAKIVMEVHKAKMGEDGKPVNGADGIYEMDKFAAIAVMEKRAEWDAGFSAMDRAGDWGFAIYNTDGSPKENNLECVTCHMPYQKNDYMFSFSSLVEAAK